LFPACAMASALPSLNRRLHIEETEFLQAAGFSVRNTFIDERSPLSLDEQPQLCRRAVTSPLPRHEWTSDDEDFDRDEVVPAFADAANEMKSDMPTDVSTADSDSDASSAQADDNSSLSVLIRRECAFLKIASVSLLPLEVTQGKRLPVKSVTHCLRVCVNGLPDLKRMKWQNPIAWVVAIALQRVGCAAIVKRSRLYAPLCPSSSQGCKMVIVDLCAPRLSDS